MSFFPELELQIGLNRRKGLLILGGLACAVFADELRKMSPSREGPRDATLATLLSRMRQMVVERLAVGGGFACSGLVGDHDVAELRRLVIGGAFGRRK